MRKLLSLLSAAAILAIPARIVAAQTGAHAEILNYASDYRYVCDVTDDMGVLVAYAYCDLAGPMVIDGGEAYSFATADYGFKTLRAGASGVQTGVDASMDFDATGESVIFGFLDVGGYQVNPGDRVVFHFSTAEFGQIANSIGASYWEYGIFLQGFGTNLDPDSGFPFDDEAGHFVLSDQCGCGPDDYNMEYAGDGVYLFMDLYGMGSFDFFYGVYANAGTYDDQAGAMVYALINAQLLTAEVWDIDGRNMANVVFDDEGNATLVATPEPASIAFMATGLVGLGVIVRRKRNRAA